MSINMNDYRIWFQPWIDQILLIRTQLLMIDFELNSQHHIMPIAKSLERSGCISMASWCNDNGTKYMVNCFFWVSDLIWFDLICVYWFVFIDNWYEVRLLTIVHYQEVETEQFYNYFLPELKRDGYDGIFSPKSRAKTMAESERRYVDGCAIFYRTAKSVPPINHLHLLTIHLFIHFQPRQIDVALLDSRNCLCSL